MKIYFLFTVDSKIRENRCKQKTELFQVMGYFIQVYHLLQYNIHRNLPVSMKNSIILLLCIFETFVQVFILVKRKMYTCILIVGLPLSNEMILVPDASVSSEGSVESAQNGLCC